MCMGSSPSTPTPPTPPPRLPEAPRTPDTSARQPSEAQRRRRRSNPDAGGTILTSSRGVTDSAPTTMKTLLGQ